jgi:hypothetical protein
MLTSPPHVEFRLSATISKYYQYNEFIDVKQWKSMVSVVIMCQTIEIDGQRRQIMFQSMANATGNRKYYFN